MILSDLFSDHMVLQANKPIRIFGEGSGEVKVDFLGVNTQKTFETNKWVLELPPLPYGGPYEMTVVLNQEEYKFKDVYLGDVYLMAGQSNMGFLLKNTYKEEIEEESCPLLRCFKRDNFTPSYIKSSDGWLPCEKETVGLWSALGYYVGHEIFKNRNHAVGVIFCYEGASVIESWISADKMKDQRFYLPLEERYLYRSVAKDSPHNENGALYEKVQQKIVPYSVSCVVWYQGESNTGTGDYKVYGELLKELIASWREDFFDNKLVFVIVQIANWDAREDEGWKRIQQIQADISKEVENTVMVKSADVCESNDIHPTRKKQLAFRIADVILNNKHC